MTQISVLADAIGARVEIVNAAAGEDAARAAAITGIDLRAQGIRPGDVFAALPGARAHGASYAGTALERGAVAVLTDEAGRDLVAEATSDSVAVLVHPEPRVALGAASATVYGHPSRSMQVIGITGTSGKTTTSYLVEAGLVAAGRVVGLVGTVETRIEGIRVPSTLTTPEAPQLHALFAVMRERGVDTVVMEVSSHALALGRVDATEFAVGGFTNLSQDHLDFHKDLDDYFGAKARLFAEDSPVRARRAVVCTDDVWGRRMAEVARAGRDDATAVRTVTTGGDGDAGDAAGAAADWTVTDEVPEETGVQQFTLTGPDGIARRATVGLPGRYNVTNAALAVALCAEVGADIDAAIRGIADVAVPGRVERVERGQDFLAVVDYAHKPAALEAVIGTLRAATEGRIAVVVGAGGDRDRTKRPIMGEVAARAADLVVVTDDNPRTESPAAIRAAVLDGAHSVPAAERGEILEIGDRAAAIDAAVAWARPGDVVLVAGKGHETGQEIDGVKHPFDDREVLGAALDKYRTAGPDGDHPPAAGGSHHGGKA
ncbi:UDP-N-acetylmuramoyl-L-alanyl-D-glutamate--2,6-diaminopimelate ligase [Rhodococcus pyridinivorans]|uniref:UDP-N-acetylmuramoyl-L-alanyl-D-glutamate--2, 6-diaminopimelate ligase n=1 Tax=Rhodococcus TaxID=1827 RepID=UPI0007EA3773|nr:MULTISPECIES: UDP-N-acetylmuramoyl-L-alanyl-D-glutamate--2,6-diaminopimelate ligase [Rhodococcus]APE09562.1 UDP-N-acetylmuramoyl-L-alanyl-D-glutamate--2,6-diaminopimelate ligase [Rhodococcus sp. 2G]OBA36485.1 UDP-N-acetylmuramoyl-L-alanyl-D-glutamate--2,6-diaminopimelate ligase [Rhodococcus sp. 852002-51564_SCH6189132-a]UPW05123.1 UDP-N-acetylmuramoyl-L-alanyl-D-glutamate--2,6-diaminopimelate ligase [Rhodococcus pyridinivorans]UVT25104.1 UDP-N-acetylmuramoyl-L-alanyl-D-glutamate--2,6-diamino